MSQEHIPIQTQENPKRFALPHIGRYLLAGAIATGLGSSYLHSQETQRATSEKNQSLAIEQLAKEFHAGNAKITFLDIKNEKGDTQLQVTKSSGEKIVVEDSKEFLQELNHLEAVKEAESLGIDYPDTDQTK